MYIFIWQNLREVSDSYHSRGSVVIIAQSLARAKEIAKFRHWEDEKGNLRQMDVDDNPVTYNIDATEEKIFVFPDAGCC